MTNDEVLDKVEYLNVKLEKNKIKVQKNKEKLKLQQQKITKLVNVEENKKSGLGDKLKMLFAVTSALFIVTPFWFLEIFIKFSTFNTFHIIIGCLLGGAGLICSIPTTILKVKLNKSAKRIKTLNLVLENLTKLEKNEEAKLQKIEEKREKLYNRLERELKRTNKRVKENVPFRMKIDKKTKKRNKILVNEVKNEETESLTK